MRTYELMVILDGDLADASLSQARNNVRSRVDEVSTVTNDDFEANRKFAYEINHKTHGHYMVLELTAEPGALDPVERALLIADEVVRHKVVRLPDDEVARRLNERANPPKQEPVTATEEAQAASTDASSTTASEPTSDTASATTTKDDETTELPSTAASEEQIGVTDA